jgi:hypothetical protein
VVVELHDAVVAEDAVDADSDGAVTGAIRLLLYIDRAGADNRSVVAEVFNRLLDGFGRQAGLVGDDTLVIEKHDEGLGDVRFFLSSVSIVDVHDAQVMPSMLYVVRMSAFSSDSAGTSGASGCVSMTWAS